MGSSYKDDNLYDKVSRRKCWLYQSVVVCYDFKSVFGSAIYIYFVGQKFDFKLNRRNCSFFFVWFILFYFLF